MVTGPRHQEPPFLQGLRPRLPFCSTGARVIIQNAISSLAVRDFASGLAWYEALLVRAPDSTPMSGVAEWKFPRGGWLQIYQQPDRAGSGSVTLSVNDLEEIVTHCESLGLDTSQRTSSTIVNTVLIVDPDGNQLIFAAAIDKTIAH